MTSKQFRNYEDAIKEAAEDRNAEGSQQRAGALVQRTAVFALKKMVMAASEGSGGLREQ